MIPNRPVGELQVGYLICGKPVHIDFESDLNAPNVKSEENLHDAVQPTNRFLV
jgi:hypothetical protein